MSPGQHVGGLGFVMVSPENRPLYQFDNLASSDLEQQRLQAIAELGLLEAESVPVFEEATQTAAHFLDMPICVLGLMDQDREWLKSAVGLSRLGLMNEIAASRQIPRGESFGTHIVASRQILSIDDTSVHPAVANSLLVQRYRIRAYLGVPLFSSAGHCLGSLAVMDLVPRTFTAKEIGFLELIARWSMSEFERNRLVKNQQVALPHKLSPKPVSLPSGDVSAATSLAGQPAANPLKIKLLAQLTQELRTPLTSVMGMTSVLNREVYGPLTGKQKEYLDIVYQSGQYLLSLVNEIVELGALDDSTSALNLASVDIEMLCQQAINTLEQAANRREQEIRLSIEPGNRIWLLDKGKVKQMLYHLVFSVIQSSGAGSVVRLHVSRKPSRLNIAIWVSNPWLGDSLPYNELYAYQASATGAANSVEAAYSLKSDSNSEGLTLSASGSNALTPVEELAVINQTDNSRECLGLLLSRQLAEMHGGQITIQGSPESGYRYVINLPQITEVDVNV